MGIMMIYLLTNIGYIFYLNIRSLVMKWRNRRNRVIILSRQLPPTDNTNHKPTLMQLKSKSENSKFKNKLKKGY